MLRVFMVSFSGSGGHPVYVNEVIVALNKKCVHDVRVEFIAPKDLEKQYFEKGYVVHAVLPAYPTHKGMSSIFWRIRQMMHFCGSYLYCFSWLRKQHDYHGVHFQDSFWLFSMFFWLFRFLRVPLFFTIHNIKPHKYSGVMPKWVEDSLYRFIWRGCDGLFIHSEKLRREVLEFLGEGYPPVYIVPHGLFLTDHSSHQKLAERMEWKKLLFFGATRKNKGLHILLQVMERLDGFSLTIAGRKDDPDYWSKEIEPLINICRTKGKSIDINDAFIPERDVPDLFHKHSVIILPYTQDFHSQSGVLHLAIALNTPMVVTNVGGIGDLVDQYKIGEISCSDKPAHLVESIERLFNRDVSGLESALKDAQEDLSWDKLAVGTCEVYKKLKIRDAG